MRILITGVTGLLGYDLWHKLKDSHEVYGCSFHTVPEYVPQERWLKLDLTNKNATYTSITKLNPDVVIHTAAWTDVDGCEKDPATAFKVNTLTGQNVAIACQRFDTTMVYISTDYVFNGDNCPENGYTEFDIPKPVNIYAKSKYCAEFYIRHLLNKFYIVRSALLFGKKRKNFITSVIESVNEKKEIKVAKEHYQSPTYTKDLSEAIQRIIELQAPYGIYHITNQGGCSREELTQTIFTILKKSTQVTLLEKKSLYYATRPTDSRLNNFMWALCGYSPLRLWQEALKEFISLQ